ncbi:MAG: VanZ family protein [Spirochaetia bacterium]
MSFRIVWLILFFIAALGILIFSLIPNPPHPVNREIDDIVLHFAAYLILGFLGVQSLIIRQITVKNFVLIMIILSAALAAYGGIIEVMQRYTGRNTNLIDLAADFAGSVAGIILGLLFRWVLRTDQK